jgi:hypothetical protein
VLERYGHVCEKMRYSDDLRVTYECLEDGNANKVGPEPRRRMKGVAAGESRSW